MTREGGSIPVTLTLQEATNKNVVLLPIGASDDGAHSQNEKIDRRNYIEGVRTINPLRPGVKLQILLLCFHTFLTEVVGRSC